MDTNNISSQRRQTRDRVKSMIVYHLATFAEIRFTDWCKTNRITPTNFSEAMAELILEGKAKRGGMYLVAGPRGYESFQIFVAAPVVEAIDEDINIRFCESCGRYGVAA